MVNGNHNVVAPKKGRSACALALACASVALLFSAQLAGVAHFVLVSHSYCESHGAVAHGDHHDHNQVFHLDHYAAASEVHGSSHDSSHAHEHEHCAFIASIEHEVAILADTPFSKIASTYSSNEKRQHPEDARKSLSALVAGPKNSPPLSL